MAYLSIGPYLPSCDALISIGLFISALVVFVFVVFTLPHGNIIVKHFLNLFVNIFILFNNYSLFSDNFENKREGFRKSFSFI